MGLYEKRGDWECVERESMWRVALVKRGSWKLNTSSSSS